MVDRRRIVRQWREGTAKVLVTLVRVDGSSYRRPGAHLLIGAGSEYAGTISGGCLEAEVVRKAAWMVRDGATVERYSTLFDDTAEIPFGLGCGGVVDLLLEPAETPECEALLHAMETSLDGAEFRVATWLPEAGRSLARAVFSADGELRFVSKSLRAPEIDSAKTGLLTSEMRVYCETLAPPLRLFVLGAGDDAKPVVTMASLLGWRVTVAEGRTQLVRPERFPEAECVLAIASAAELRVAATDAVVVMSHSYEQDRSLLTGLLGASEVPGYIGLLGAMHRSSLLVSEAAAALGLSVAECCQRVWAPVGLDLGGDGAEAIALAVIAEVQAWREGKLGGSRRLTPERVAEQIAKGGASRYLQTQCALGLMTAAVVLAAGASTRLGEPKQLIVVGGETLLERAVRVAREAGCAPVVIVLGAAYLEILARNQFHDAVPVINDMWAEGRASSIRLGVRTLGLVARDANGVVLMTCDQPAVTAEHLRRLMTTGAVTASAYAGRPGVPAYFPAASFAELMRLTGDAGARELLREAASVELPGGELDIDTEADRAEAERRYR